MYEVIHFFTDLQDFSHAYKVGDSFPRPGMKVDEARLKELSGSKNKQGKPLIRFVEEKDSESTAAETKHETADAEADAVKVHTKTGINRLPKDDLVSLATEKGVENASELSGNELKAKLISILGL